MLKKLLLTLVALSFTLSSLSAQPVSSVDRMREIVEELEQISKEKESYLNKLENIDNERLKELNEREAELEKLQTQLLLFGNLIDDQALYFKNLQKKLTFWKITSGILAASLTATILLTR